ncbi:hypothetical protein ACFX2J_046505 [Malus domestica]
MLTRLDKADASSISGIDALTKLPMIFAKLNVHVRDADTSGKADGSPISKLASSSSELRRVQRLHVTSVDKFGTEDGPWFLSKPNF